MLRRDAMLRVHVGVCPFMEGQCTSNCHERHVTASAHAVQRVLQDICGAVTETGQRALLLAGKTLPLHHGKAERRLSFAAIMGHALHEGTLCCVSYCLPVDLDCGSCFAVCLPVDDHAFL